MDNSLPNPDENGRWTCPNCGWFQQKHPLFVWSAHDIRAVEVHQQYLCPNKEDFR